MTGRTPVYERGNVARFSTTFTDDDGRRTEPDIVDGDRDVSILIKRRATGEVILESTQMIEVSPTKFRFDFQTTQGTPLGEYSVEISARFSGEQRLNRDRIEIVDILDPNVGQ